MKNILYVALFFLSGCGGLKTTYLEEIPDNTVIDRSLYEVSVPQGFSGDQRKWERYSKDGVPDDLILKYSEGIVIPSYAASIEVTRNIKGVKTINDLQTRMSENTEFLKYAVSKEIKPYKTAQPFLLCIRPAFHNDSAPDRPYGMFWHKMNCVDLKTYNYYELNVSYMSGRKSVVTPPNDLLPMVENFFRSFKVKEYGQ